MDESRPGRVGLACLRRAARPRWAIAWGKVNLINNYRAHPEELTRSRRASAAGWLHRSPRGGVFRRRGDGGGREPHGEERGGIWSGATAVPSWPSSLGGIARYRRMPAAGPAATQAALTRMAEPDKKAFLLASTRRLGPRSKRLPSRSCAAPTGRSSTSARLPERRGIRPRRPQARRSVEVYRDGSGEPSPSTPRSSAASPRGRRARGEV